jgi:hypothetical protein
MHIIDIISVHHADIRESYFVIESLVSRKMNTLYIGMDQ